MMLLLVLQNIITYSVNVADNIMLGVTARQRCRRRQRATRFSTFFSNLRLWVWGKVW